MLEVRILTTNRSVVQRLIEQAAASGDTVSIAMGEPIGDETRRALKACVSAMRPVVEGRSFSSREIAVAFGAGCEALERIERREPSDGSAE